MGKQSSFALAFHRNQSGALRVCLGHRQLLPCHLVSYLWEVTKRWKPEMEMPFPMPGGYDPVCCLGHWPSTPHPASPALLELLPQGLDCRWSMGAILLLTPLGSIPSGRKHRPRAARRFKDMVHPYLNWKLLEGPSQPSGFSIRLLALFHRGVFKVRKRPCITGEERKGLLAKHFWFQLLVTPRIPQIFAEGYKSAHQRDNLFRDQSYFEDLDFGKEWSKSERFIPVQHFSPSTRIPGDSKSVRVVLITLS